jgi:two-component system sensor histidine kinase KdpD
VIDELEIVDIPPEDLLQRIRDGPVLTPPELARAMQRELRLPVLRMLREASLRMIADHADRQLQAYLPAAGVPLEFRGRVVLCLPPRTGLEERIRLVADHASRQDAKFVVVSVRTRSLSEEATSALGGYATLTHQLGGIFHRLDGRRVAPSLARFIRETQATEVVLGHRHRHRRLPWDVTTELIRRLAGVDVHILSAARR